MTWLDLEYSDYLWWLHSACKRRIRASSTTATSSAFVEVRDERRRLCQLLLGFTLCSFLVTLLLLSCLPRLLLLHLPRLLLEPVEQIVGCLWGAWGWICWWRFSLWHCWELLGYSTAEIITIALTLAALIRNSDDGVKLWKKRWYFEWCMTLSRGTR